ncbi:hypothetical protein HC928_11885, partial [bacterium]|nr:hypothetical protein [bacterium]
MHLRNALLSVRNGHGSSRLLERTIGQYDELGDVMHAVQAMFEQIVARTCEL